MVTTASPPSSASPYLQQSWHQFIPSSQTWSRVETSGPPRQASELGRNLDPKLRIVTWNVDAGAHFTESRLEAIVSHILCQKPVADIIFFQEVSRPALLHLLKDTRIRDSWFSTEADTTNWGGHIFATMMLVSKARFGPSNKSMSVSALGPVWRVKFPSRFGRDALCSDIFVSSPTDNSSQISRLRLINVHLDSLALERSRRPEQLSIAAEMLRETGKGLIAGDFNPVLPEDNTLVAYNGLVDAWTKVHDSEPGFTWGVDGKQAFPPGRLDKIAILGLQPHEIEVMHPGVIEKEEFGVGQVPWSDHSGLRCTFEV
ncbi:uncharacterized protein NECHADRAFT_35874 [Fusarium vanettenii 77-13-4]|uniref:Endonuclease/exonuclease/phosphatase domain-containing protein n=1 Tax=Fusarium vanettenii (strain ATCC MYA-4622 / CBS 123669 / FGSC 9596 / NRRL 45880 / 77-13-4) TaxID=660122 RepID=C7YN51_FUSV7|nr:uncharacterized protein NECHADRAFT_35874 [Fusarium vanettenii 77-13-4]EEU47561.1 hypothetical protein NECHADRAFT_35874 [Fusarium vanettenii 77-13-4]